MIDARWRETRPIVLWKTQRRGRKTVWMASGYIGMPQGTFPEPFGLYYICLYDEQPIKCCEVGRKMRKVIGQNPALKLVSLIHCSASLASF